MAGITGVGKKTAMGGKKKKSKMPPGGKKGKGAKM